MFPSLDEMTKEEFDAKMARGLAQAQSEKGMPVREFFDSLIHEIQDQQNQLQKQYQEQKT